MGDWCSTLRVDYPNSTFASMVVKALEVDAELQAVRVSRSIRAEGSRVVCLFGSDEARLLRASVCTFCDLMAVATRTLEEFGA